MDKFLIKKPKLMDDINVNENNINIEINNKESILSVKNLKVVRK